MSRIPCLPIEESSNTQDEGKKVEESSDAEMKSSSGSEPADDRRKLLPVKLRGVNFRSRIGSLVRMTVEICMYVPSRDSERLIVKYHVVVVVVPFFDEC